MARYFLRARKFLVHNVLHADDTPHAIALGVSIATFITFLPLIGLQTILSVTLAAIFRANKAVCFPIVWITNPVTAIPIYYPCFVLGRLILGPSGGLSGHEVIQRLTHAGTKGSMLEVQFWKDMLFTMAGLGVELWVGSAMVAALLALLSYPFSRWAISAYRERHRQRLLRRQLFRSNLVGGQVSRSGEIG